jgi:hypothetical protein
MDLKRCRCGFQNSVILICIFSQPSGGSAKAATIVLETLTYLEKTPATKYSPEKFKDFVQKLEDLKIDLTHAERLLILNHCPRVSRLFFNEIDYNFI